VGGHAGLGGGDSSTVQDEQKEAVAIYSTDFAFAFAAKLTSGHVMTWGATTYGGDGSTVCERILSMDADTN
jgi:hypothetical protein